MKINPTFSYSIIFLLASLLKFTMSLAPVPYVSTFRSKDLETTKFIQVLPDHTEKHEVHTYTGREGLEAVIHCNSRFLRVALKCNWTPQQKFEKYENILNDGALQYWSQTVIPSVWEDPATESMFVQALQVMVSHYSGCDKARDFIIEYVQSKNCKKTMKTTVNDHVNRIEYLLHIANLCEGEEDYISDSRVKRLLFNTFPAAWKTNFTNSGRIITDLTLPAIQQYFNLQKKLSDANAASYYDLSTNTNNKRNNNQGRGSRWTNNKRNKRNHGNQRNFDQNSNPSICRHVEHKHLNKKHLWKDCIYNPRSQNYRGRPYEPSRSFRPSSGNQARASNNRGTGSNQSNYRGRGNYSSNNNAYSRSAQANTRNEQHENEESSTSNHNVSHTNSEVHAYDSIGSSSTETPKEDIRDYSVANVGWRLGTGNHAFI